MFLPQKQIMALTSAINAGKDSPEISVFLYPFFDLLELRKNEEKERRASLFVPENMQKHNAREIKRLST